MLQVAELRLHALMEALTASGRALAEDELARRRDVLGDLNGVLSVHEDIAGGRIKGY